jgi:hypothetical protein
LRANASAIYSNDDDDSENRFDDSVNDGDDDNGDV